MSVSKIHVKDFFYLSCFPGLSLSLFLSTHEHTCIKKIKPFTHCFRVREDAKLCVNGTRSLGRDPSKMSFCILGSYAQGKGSITFQLGERKSVLQVVVSRVRHWLWFFHSLANG